VARFLPIGALVLLFGVALSAWWAGSETAGAQLLAAAAVLVVTVLLFTTGPRRPVALKPFEYADGKSMPKAGLELPADALADPNIRENEHYKFQRGLFFRSLYMGTDGRWSTSKLQVLLWTYAILWALAAILLARVLGSEDGYDSLHEAGIDDWGVYLVFLGGPFAAFVLSRGITAAKVEDGTLAKPPSEPTSDPGQGLSEVISDDAGEVDIVDLQYFLFNVLAIGYFLVLFVPDLAGGLPAIPELIAVLTGASAATYVGKKATEREQPTITTILPTKARTGHPIEVWGRSLVLGERSREERKPRISVGATEVPEADVAILEDIWSGVDHLRCRMPTTVEPGETKIRIVTLAGVAAESPLEVESGVRIRGVSHGKIRRDAPVDITLTGEGFGALDGTAVVLLDDVRLDAVQWSDTDIVARMNPNLAEQSAYTPNQQAKLVVQTTDGRRSQGWLIAVE
jgi:hypothetical protein